MNTNVLTEATWATFDALVIPAPGGDFWELTCLFPGPDFQYVCTPYPMVITQVDTTDFK
jgi:hypothetical protein